MKKIVLALCAALLLNTGCQKTLEEEFKNPLKYTPPPDDLIPGMFTQMVTQYKFYIKDYGEWWWQLTGLGIFAYAQIAERYITDRYSFYIDYDDFSNHTYFDASISWFNDYYIRMRNWGLIRDNMEKITEKSTYTDNIIYFNLAGIVKGWGALRNIDLYNAIPYKEAFKGTQGVFFTPYDDPKELYVLILDELQKYSSELPSLKEKMSPKAQAKFKDQDVFFAGDIDKWVRYANALRLRYAVKLSGVDAETAKKHIADAIKNLPQQDYYWILPHIDAAGELPGGGTWNRGLYERAYCSFIPNIIMNRMNFHKFEYEKDIDDPRLPVLALPTKHKDYRGVSMNADAQKADYINGERYYPFANNLEASLLTPRSNSKSMWSHVTLTHNNVPADIFTLAEVDLLLAEIAAKNLVTTDKSASEHIKDAVTHSTHFWYAINALSQYEKDFSDRDFRALLHPEKPSDAIIESYAEKVKVAFDKKEDLSYKMEMIMQQKYIHINLLRPYLLFGELRRTRHPKLEPLTFKTKVMKPMPERLRYPSSELQNNADNFLKVVDQDNFTSQIFWVPEQKRKESYYRNTYVTFKTSVEPNFD